MIMKERKHDLVTEDKKTLSNKAVEFICIYVII
jgi:hypothetical protein